ncbi:MAG: lysophospholipid acyltransferase family protein [Gammaproteobacteria bacterium]|jgi:1-acyl-sn-glycerol-3-phosphate acyltransferase
MGKLIISYRLVRLGLVISTGTILTLLFQRGTLPPAGIQSRITRWWHRNIAKSVGVRVHVFGRPREQATLFVSNHISSFDIAALGSVLPVRFLSKSEVSNWPLIGWLATRAGTLYIQRGGRQAAVNANKAIAEVLSMNHNVLLFAEGTTTDGNVKRFHSRLMQSAVDSGAHIQPVAIRYPDPGGSKVHPAVLYIDGISFIDSTRRILGTRQLEVEIYFGDAVTANSKSRDELARYAETEVRRLLAN